MPAHVYIDQLKDHVGAEVTLKGWLYNKRSSKKIHFLQVRDGTGIVQCVASREDVGEESFARADKLAQETSLIVTGIVAEDKRSPIGVELHAKQFTVVAEPTREYPITPKDHGTAFLMEHRHLWLRSRRQ